MTERHSLQKLDPGIECTTDVGSIIDNWRSDSNFLILHISAHNDMISVRVL